MDSSRAIDEFHKVLVRIFFMDNYFDGRVKKKKRAKILSVNGYCKLYFFVGARLDRNPSEGVEKNESSYDSHCCFEPTIIM